MDHLSRPYNPVRPPVRVPYLCKNYRPYFNTKLGFDRFSEHFGHNNDRLKKGDLSHQTLDQAAPFLQAWLFFRVLGEISDICQVEFSPEDFIQEAPDGLSVITTEQLNRYIWYWIAAESELTITSRNEHIARADACLELAKDVVNGLSTAQVQIGVSPCIGSPSAAVHLSLAVIGDTLSQARSSIFHANNPSLFTPLRWISSPLGEELLLKAGWCVGELASLYQGHNAAVLYYLSGLGNVRMEKYHAACGREMGCVANQLNEETYVTRHIDSCGGCESMFPPMERISAILRKDSIPLLCATRIANSDDLYLEVTEFSPGTPRVTTPYIAISHVWSDGMGNPRQNSLPTCQVERIQGLVQALCGSVTRAVPFWIDTLCVPLHDGTRQKAIALMAKTYVHAEKVLVLDASLQKISHEISPEECLVRIKHSVWNSRLWTLQEGMLARDCYFQFQEASLTIDELERMPTNLKTVARILETQDQKKLLDRGYTKRLVRVLAFTDDLATDWLRHYASLPKQTDPEEEALRLQAIQTIDERASNSPSPEYWASLIAQPGLDPVFTNSDDRLRTHVNATILDPVVKFGLAALRESRGITYQLSLDREKDLLAPGRRLVMKPRITPYVLFSDVMRSLSGRSTSKLQDETICAGGLLGIDVMPILRIASDDESKVTWVTQKRIQAFLEQIGSFPATIVFWNVPRLEEVGWRWAPSSFLNRNPYISTASPVAYRRPEGLVVTYPGIRLCLDKEHTKQLLSTEVPRTTGILSITYDPALSPNTYPFRRSWQLVQIVRHSQSLNTVNKTWREPGESGWGNSLTLVVHGDSYEGILVSVRREGDGIAFVAFLAHVKRVRVSELEDERPFQCVGQWVEEQTWCIG